MCPVRLLKTVRLLETLEYENKGLFILKKKLLSVKLETPWRLLISLEKMQLGYSFRECKYKIQFTTSS